MSAKTVTHRFNVWITAPAVSGDGWSQYPDYSAAETGRLLRRILDAAIDTHNYGVVVEHGDTVPD